MKKIVLFLALANICALYGSAYDDIKQNSVLTKDELEVYNALLNAGMSPKEVDVIIHTNKLHSCKSQLPLAQVSASQTYTSLHQKTKLTQTNLINLPNPKKNKEFFRKRMVELYNANNSKRK